MYKAGLLVLSSLLFLAFVQPENFKTTQLKYDRVRKAYAEKGQIVTALLGSKSITHPELVIRAFKQEKELELWAREAGDGVFRLLKTYPICATSGQLGPKRKQGDFQIPEGFYVINAFNPWSNYHLSLKLNYPNASDKILGDAARPGGDIFIHGDCVTIGCIPLTDDLIKEVYVFAVEAKAAGQSAIPVYIFPLRMTNDNMQRLTSENGDDPALLSFWKNLQTGYLQFENSHLPLRVIVDKTGKYQFP